MLNLYLLGNFRMPLDSKVEKISVSRLMFAIVFGSFTLYLLPGLWGAPLHLISGFPPPQFYSEMPQGFSSGGSTISADIPEGADPEHCPHSLNCFHDFEEGLAYAKEVNKPVMLDFTGWGCVNCRKMEEQVWSDPRVLKRLREEVVLVSLYVDERIKLPEDEQYYSEVLQSKVKTIGNKWSEFQAMHYETNSQPYYVIIGHESLEPLLPPTAYDPDIEFFINWLDKGVELYEAQ
jgi:thiol:disulfide interchange protein DsbD